MWVMGCTASLATGKVPDARRDFAGGSGLIPRNIDILNGKGIKKRICWVYEHVEIDV